MTCTHKRTIPFRGYDLFRCLYCETDIDSFNRPVIMAPSRKDLKKKRKARKFVRREEDEE